MARLHPTWQTPVDALGAQGVVALLLLVSGTYGQLLDYVVFADWIFFGSTAASLFVLRARDRNSDGRAQLHPLGILTFIAAAVYVLVGSVQSNPGNAARGAGLLLLGIPVYLYWNHRRSRTGDVAT
jgi:APA family basic amino acid/polyamine antiporter